MTGSSWSGSIPLPIPTAYLGILSGLAGLNVLGQLSHGDGPLVMRNHHPVEALIRPGAGIGAASP
jgi:hypothetical protein